MNLPFPGHYAKDFGMNNELSVNICNMRTKYFNKLLFKLFLKKAPL